MEYKGLRSPDPAYIWCDSARLFRRPNRIEFDYSDGDEVEECILDAVRQSGDRSTFSNELQRAIQDWPSEYHFSRARHCLLRPLRIPSGSKVLELGCGCGAVTRFLGEIGADVLAIEGSARRARVAAERCRDLSNVRIAVDNFLDFQTEERFDWILLLGVLEYAPLFCRGNNPVQEYLGAVSSLLAPKGRLVIAIENKVGLKYFNGCAEDHLGRPFTGIQDLYGAKTPRTFTRLELKRQLSEAGFIDSCFYYPFPDYKLPSVILTQEAIGQPCFDPVDLLLRSQSRDYGGSIYRSFDEGLAYKSLNEGGLIADLSNSFLIVASRHSNLQANRELAYTYATNRRPEFCTETRFRRDDSGIRVVKEYLLDGVRPTLDVRNYRLANVQCDSDYVPGKQILWDLLSAKASQANEDALAVALAPWFRTLLDMSEPPVPIAPGIPADLRPLRSYAIAGRYLDLTPFNLLDHASTLVPIDLEWRVDGDIPLGWVVTRGVLHSLRAGIDSSHLPYTLTSVVRAVARAEGLSVDDEDVELWLQHEIELQTAVTGQPPSGWTPESISSGLKSFTAEMSARQKQIVELGQRIAVLQESVAGRETEISSLAHRLQESVAGREAEISSLTHRMQESVAEREKEISSLAHRLQGLEADLSQLNRIRGSLEDQLQASRSSIADKNGLILQKNHAIADLRKTADIRINELVREVTGSQAQVNDLRDEVGAYQRRIAMLESSFSWRVLQEMQRLSAKYPTLSRKARTGMQLLWWTLTLQLPQRIRDRRQFLRERRLLASSPLFNADWYLSRYRDVAENGCDPVTHYLAIGTTEGRNPGPEFDTAYYLDKHRDVAEEGVNPLVHYLQIGATEGRTIRPVESRTDDVNAGANETLDYSEWVSRYDTLTAFDVEAIQRHISSLREKPLISVVLPVYNPEIRFLRRALDSVVAQLYPNWELCIADDASTNPEVRELLQEYELGDRRVKVAYRQSNGHISAASNSALELVSGKYVALLDHDDEFAAHALYIIASELNEHPDTDIAYSDEDKIDAEGRRSGPYFKTGWDPDLFYGHNMVNHLGVYRTALIREIGGFREGYEGSQDYDLVLRLLPLTKTHKIRHIPHVLYHWRLGEGLSTYSTNSMEKAVAAARRALADHFEHLGKNAHVTASRISYWNRIEWPLPAPLPPVSLIIPTRDSLPSLRGCLEGLLRRTDYENLQVILVDHGSRDPQAMEYLASLSSEPRILVLKLDEPSDLAAAVNRAVTHSNGDILGFIHNDLDVIQSSWLKEMVCQAIRPEVGAVGAKLYDSSDRIQEAGLVLGMKGIVGYGQRGFPRSADGYFGRLQLVHGVSAVTAACMMLRKSVFEEVGGFDEANLKDAYHDVDLCLKIRQIGYSIVWTPYAELYHLNRNSSGLDYTPRSTASIRQGRLYMEQRWASELENDSFYSPNLSLDAKDFSLAFPPRINKPWTDFISDSAQGSREPAGTYGDSNTLAKQLADIKRLARQQALTLQRLQRQVRTSGMDI
jgi:glycosyltransferase involved in cell wall biosynthesis/SAM-dependent methyltransferase